MFAGILQAQIRFYDFKIADIDGNEFDVSSKSVGCKRGIQNAD
jgi:hypothetical protein